MNIRANNFERLGIRPGAELTYVVHNPLETHPREPSTDIVESIAAGGFHGHVLILPESVIKTGEPRPLYNLLRRLNWGTPFPPQASWAAAQRSALIGKLLHRIIPKLTQDRITTPDVYGSTVLHRELGHSLVLQRMRGRGARFDKSGENALIREAREKIWDIGKKLGLATTAQVHPNNPFGKPNIWIDPNKPGSLVWANVHPAMRHTGVYRFHREVRETLGSTKPTFSDVNFDRLDTYLLNNQSLFTPEELAEIQAIITALKKFTEQQNEWEQRDPKDLFIEDGQTRGKLTPQQAESLRQSDVKYKLYQARENSSLVLQVAREKMANSPLAAIKNFEWMRLISDKKFVIEIILRKTMLAGLHRAEQAGVITKDEYKHSLDAVPESDLKFYMGIQASYFVFSRLIDAVCVALAPLVLHHENPAAAIRAIAAINLLLPSLARCFSTLIVNRCTDRELSDLAFKAAWPVTGTYASVPWKIMKTYDSGTNIVAHHTNRAFIAALTSVIPGGGWNSDLEEKVWDRLAILSQLVAKLKMKGENLMKVKLKEWLTRHIGSGGKDFTTALAETDPNSTMLQSPQANFIETPEVPPSGNTPNEILGSVLGDSLLNVITAILRTMLSKSVEHVATKPDDKN